MGDLLKEAIADAKAVRETALQNAKMALEEAFTPQLKSMLSAKLKEDEFEDELEVPEVPAEEDEEMFGGEEEVPAEVPHEEDEDIFGGDEEEVAVAPEETEDMFGGEEDEVEETITLNGVTYAPIRDGVRESDDAYPEGAEASNGDDYVHESNLDLEAVIKELETEINEEDDAYDENVEGKEQANHVGGSMDGVSSLKTEAEGDDDEEVEVDESIFKEEEEHDDDDKEEVDEQSDSSKIGTGDNKVDYADAGDEEDPGDSTDIEAMGEGVNLKKRLKEYQEAVKFLKDKLHEVNILNAKLLFTNKLFKEYSLNNGQKLKVVETFDRAQTTREIKLVYSTLAEQFGDNGTIKKRNISESASTKVSSTKPSGESKKVITEETQVADRFRKLAGLIK
jgi:hypothetical protein